MENRKRRIGIGDVVLVAISAIFFIGILTFFKPCGPKDDGGWMTCHWAGHAVAGVAAVLLVISIVHLIIPNTKIKMGLSVAAIPVAVLAAVIPGNVINLCMMDTMRCHVVTYPATIVMSVLVIAAAVFDIIVNHRKG